jgi:hypothetical protein
MITLQEKPVEQLQAYNSQYCHVLCCHPVLALCGAYKPKRCNTSVTNSLGQILQCCPVCKKEMCPDCYEVIFDPCAYCKDSR